MSKSSVTTQSSDTKTLIKDLSTDMTIIEYIKIAGNIHNPKVDTSFMDYFMKLYNNDTNNDDINISAEKLAEYGVLSIDSNRKSIQGGKIKRLLERLHLVENVDYLIRTQQGSNSRGAPKDMYYLTHKAFKICLISSENENKYRNYYLFLEECIHYYNIGQINKLHSVIVEKENVIVEKESSISRLERSIQEMMLNMTQSEIRMNEERVQERIRTEQRHSELLSEHARTQITLDKIIKKLDDVAVPPSDKELTERFVIMKKGHEFYVIRSQLRRINTAIKEKQRDGFKIIEDLDSISIPNSTYLWNCIKKELIEKNHISSKYNTFGLNDLSEYELIDIIKKVFESRNKCN